METTTEAKTPKARVNGIKSGEWVNGKLRYEFIHGATLVVDPAQMSPKMRDAMMQHGIEARVGDKGAVEAKDFPDRNARAAEAERRMRGLVEHLHSGTDDWEMKVTRQTAGPDIGLLIRAMIALGHASDPDAANDLFTKVAAKREVTRDEAIALFWASKDVATKVLELRAAGKTYAHDAGDLLKGL